MGPLGIPLIVIVIFLVVWIVSNVIRAQQDAAQAAARRQNMNRQAGAAPRGVENRGSSDIDRFLQEIDRLRKKGHQEKQQQQDERAAPPAPPPPKPRPVGERRPEPSRRPSGAPRPQREPRPVPPSSPPPPPSPRAPAPIVPELVAAPQPITTTSKPGSLASSIEAKAETARAAAEVASRAVPTLGAKIQAPSRPQAAGTAAALSPTLQLIQKLFRTKQGGAAAVILHEILGPPRSRKA
jgi:outer membrane biosynthesis protein TonB